MTPTPPPKAGTISTRLRDYGLTDDPHIVLCDKRAVDAAAGALDALVSALEEARQRLALYAQPGRSPHEDPTYSKIGAALALVRKGEG